MRQDEKVVGWPLPHRTGIRRMIMSATANNNGTSNSTAATAGARAGKYLTFQLRGEIYGLEILKVQEIIGMMKVTRVPRTPAFIRGVINLRGKVIPVVDLRLKFSMESQADTEKTCIIVVQVIREGGLKI